MTRPPGGLAVALAAVRAGCRAAQAVGRLDPGEAVQKPDQSPVTAADLAAQAAALRVLATAFPDDPVVAEERGGLLREPGRRGLLARVAAAAGLAAEAVPGWIDRGVGEPGTRFWTLDPVDGTQGLVRGGQYAVALALVTHGRVALGALGCPRLGPRGAEHGAGVVLWAARGRGAWQQPLDGGEPPSAVRVSATDDPGALRLCEPFEAAHTRHEVTAQILAALGVRTPAVRLDSQAKYALVARGDADAYWRLPPDPARREPLWDHAAGSLLVEEAGGRVTDLGGRALEFGRGTALAGNLGVVASNGRLHDRLLAALRSAGVPAP